jgi:LmbE family N-acetylglucosaminyl deacetylase
MHNIVVEKRMSYRRRSIVSSFVMLLGLIITGYLPFEGVAQASAAAPSLKCANSDLNIVAHEDDDILFMNPDIQHSIAQKRCVETVFLTSGEWNGTSSMNRRQYAASRMKGTQAGYAVMAKVANSWTYTTSVFDGHRIEVATLKGAPKINLIYIDIRDGKDNVSPYSLIDLYTGKKSSIKTIVPTSVPAGVVATTYTKAGLTRTLQVIMSSYKASTIRTQDYLPSPELYPDHVDHVNGAKFATDAARDYAATLTTGVDIVAYRDYNIIDSPVNLSTDQENEKNEVINAYKAHDSIFAHPGSQDDLASRMYYRFPVASTWVSKNKNGQLQAFAVLGGELMSWKQTTSGSWGGMTKLGNSSLQPGLSIITNPDGTLQVFAVKQTVSSTGFVTQNIQYTKQTVANGAFSAWTTIGGPGAGPSGSYAGGNPPGVTSSGDYDISSPVAVLSANGSIQVYVKDSSGDLAAYNSASPSGGWTTVSGSNGKLIESPAAILGTNGLIQVFSASTGTVQHWTQQVANGPLVYDASFVTAKAVGTPSVGLNQDGRIEIFYREASSGRVYTVFQTTSGTWSAESSLVGEVSEGAPAVINTVPVPQSTSEITLVERTSQSGYQTIAQHSANGSFTQPWKALSLPYSQFAPAAALDNSNVIHYFTISQGGSLITVASASASISTAPAVSTNPPATAISTAPAVKTTVPPTTTTTKPTKTPAAKLGTISLTVLGASDKPVNNAKVVLDGQSTMISGKNGVILFSKVAAGSHALTISASGKKTAKRIVSLASGQAGVLTVKLVTQATAN